MLKGYYTKIKMILSAYPHAITDVYDVNYADGYEDV